MTGIPADIMNMLHPGLIMIGLGFLAVILPRFMRIPLGILAPSAAMWALLQINENSILEYDVASYIRMNLIRCDSIAFDFVLLFCIMGVMTGIFGAVIRDKYECGLSLIYAGCAMGTVLAGDCISLVLFWEASLAASACIIYSGRKHASAGASFRYLLIHAAGAGMMLTGVIIYMFHYGNDLQNITYCFGEPCFWLIAAAAALNAAIPPLHAWLPDAFPESSETGILSLSVFGPGTAVYLMIRMFGGLELMIWAGIIAGIYSAVMSLMENDLRRLLSYQIISQIGIIIAAIGAGGEKGTDAAVLHTFTSILCMSVLLMCTGALMHSAGKSKITELAGAARKLPVTAVCFLISSLALSGMPGLAGYEGRAMTADLVEGSGNMIQSVLLVVCCAGTILAVTLRVNWFVFFGPAGDREATIIDKKPSGVMMIAILLGTAAIIASGICPGVFSDYLPGGTELKAFSFTDLIGYLAVFAGCAIPFFLFIRRMMPRDEITLDLDWFARKIVK